MACRAAPRPSIDGPPAMILPTFLWNLWLSLSLPERGCNCRGKRALRSLGYSGVFPVLNADASHVVTKVLRSATKGSLECHENAPAVV